MFANDIYGCCVISGRAHQTLRFEDIEQGSVLMISDKDVLKEYLKETGGVDSGLVVLDSLKEWRHDGWKVGKKTYKIQAYAQVNFKDREEVRRAVFANVGLNNSPVELLEIFERFCTSSGFRLSQSAKEKVSQLLTGLYEVRDTTFGNARVARNLFEQVISHQANRIVSLPMMTDAVLETIESVDIPGHEEKSVSSGHASKSLPPSPNDLSALSIEPAQESIRFPCPSCGKSIKAPGKMAGKEAACPSCTIRIVVPSGNEPEGVSMRW